MYGVTTEHATVAGLTFLLLHSYRYRIGRFFRLNFHLATNSGSAFARAAEQKEKAKSLQSIVEERRQHAVGLHNDLDHVDGLLG